MTVAGCSGTPLPKTLGIEEGMVVALLHAPTGFDVVLGELPPGVDVKVCAIDATWRGLELVLRKELRPPG